MTATDKLALNYLYQCKNIDSTVLVEFMREENERVNNQLMMMRDQTITREEVTTIETNVADMIKEIRIENENEMTKKDEMITKTKDDMNNLSAISEAAFTETKINLANKDRKIAALEDQVSLLSDEVTKNIEILKVTFNYKLASQETKMTDILDRMTRMEVALGDRRVAGVEEERVTRLEETVARMRSPPVAIQCGWRRNDWTEDNSTITYDKLTLSALSRVSGGLDTNTGVFTAGYPGIWSITFTMRSFKPKTGVRNMAWLYLNGEKIEETLHLTYYSGSKGYVGSQGSRTIFLQLNQGDEVTLRTGEIYSLSYITLCFELAHFD